MRGRGYAVRYPPGVGGVIGEFYKHLLEDGCVDSKLFGKVLDASPTLNDKFHFLNALVPQVPTDQRRDWIEAFGVAWRWTYIMCRSQNKQKTVEGQP